MNGYEIYAFVVSGVGYLYDDDGENINYMSDEYSNTTIKYTHSPDELVHITANTHFVINFSILAIQ